MTETKSLPEGPLVAWYGDDFTGSAAVLEELSFAGVPSVLYVKQPTAKQRALFVDMRGIGLAGTARARTPEWMEQNLPDVFGFLAGIGAPITHYKFCSTMDSSPETGSIGKALDIAEAFFDTPILPIYPASPAIGRYQVFGNLFARGEGSIHRLDRHPVMASHPVTPMGEADVVRHLSYQTDAEIGLVDLEVMRSIGDVEARVEELLEKGQKRIFFDTVSASDLKLCGEIFWKNANNLFVAGSQGVEEALVSYWQSVGALPPPPDQASAGRQDTMIVVSGSLSSVTAQQMDWAFANGFQPIALEVARLAANTDADIIARAVDASKAALSEGLCPLIYAARGIDDPAVEIARRAFGGRELSVQEGNALIGALLGKILSALLEETNVTRAVIAGGDTSGHATNELSIFALTVLSRTVPAAGLYKVWSDNPRFADMEIAFKGGQMGTVDYFGWMRDGGGAQRSP